MKRKRSALLGLVLVPLAALSAQAGEGDRWVYPAIDGYGKVAPMPGAALQPKKDARYRLALDVTAGSKSGGKVNPALDKVARTLNTFAAGGVEPKTMRAVAVVHGDATWAVLENERYRKKYGTSNPNLPLLRKLRDEGVTLVVCGQALAHRGLDPDQVSQPVSTALAATVALAELQRRRYQVLSM